LDQAVQAQKALIEGQTRLTAALMEENEQLREEQERLANDLRRSKRGHDHHVARLQNMFKTTATNSQAEHLEQLIAIKAAHKNQLEVARQKIRQGTSCGKEARPSSFVCSS
jgi:hypothetical protein